MKRTFLLLLVTFCISGCTSTVPVNYLPSTSISGDERVAVDEFTYIPAEEKKVSKNQFQKATPSIGQMYVNNDVKSIVEMAVRKELAYAGYNVDTDSSTRIDADITRFYYDWVGFSEVDFEVGITFYLKKNGNLELKHDSFSHIKAPKTLTNDPEAVRSAISQCIDDFLFEAKERALL